MTRPVPGEPRGSGYHLEPSLPGGVGQGFPETEGVAGSKKFPGHLGTVRRDGLYLAGRCARRWPVGGCGARGSCEKEQRACVHMGMERSRLGERL